MSSRLFVLFLSILGATPGCRVRRPPPEQVVPSAAAPVPSTVPSTLASAFPELGDASTDAAEAADAEPPPKGTEVIALAGRGVEAGLDGLLREAVRNSLGRLAEGKVAPDAAVRGLERLERSPSVSAGVGVPLRVDGSVEVEAALMTSAGEFAAVAAVRDLPTPSRVVARLLGSRRPVVVGAGATQIAALAGFTNPTIATPERIVEWRLWSGQRDGGAPWPWPLFGDAGVATDSAVPDAGDAAGSSVDGGAEESPEVPSVGEGQTSAYRGPAAVLVRTADGIFAAGVSGGGPEHGLPGQIGALPVPGAALYVGVRGAVVVLGPDPLLISEQLARGVYGQLKRTGSPKLAAGWGLKQAGKSEFLTVVVLGLRGRHVLSKTNVDWLGWQSGEWSRVEVTP